MVNLKDVFENMELIDDQESMTYNSRVLLVDATNLFIRCYSAVPSMDANGNHIGGMLGFLKSLGASIRTFKPSRVVIVFDGAGGSQARRKIYPAYKQNRKPPIRLNRAYDLTTDDEEKENMKYQLVSLVEMLECLPVTIFALENVEADDVIAYISQLISSSGGNSIIHSTDKDFLQLASESVTIHSPTKKKTFTEQVILEDYGIHPIHFHFFRALNGDPSDNINGVKGVGEITLKKYLPELADPTVTIDVNFIRNKFTGTKKVPKLITNILNNEDIIKRNIKLMDLSESIMSVDSRLKIANTFNATLPTIDKYVLTKLLTRTSLLPVLPSYDSWMSQTFIPLIRFNK